MDIEYWTLFESYRPYKLSQVKGANGKLIEREEVSDFAKCSQRMIVKNVKVGKGSASGMRLVTQGKVQSSPGSFIGLGVLAAIGLGDVQIKAFARGIFQHFHRHQ